MPPTDPSERSMMRHYLNCLLITCRLWQPSDRLTLEWTDQDSLHIIVRRPSTQYCISHVTQTRNEVGWRPGQEASLVSASPAVIRHLGNCASLVTLLCESKVSKTLTIIVEGYFLQDLVLLPVYHKVRVASTVSIVVDQSAVWNQIA